MATTDALTDHDHGDDHHDHPPFLAHHFDTPEQQFDSGKLGMWLFLVTEVLFFSGLFCAYAIYRMLRPEVFSGCSEFLNTQLGAINTGVLLFSSLTMAWAVRCAQVEEYKRLTGMLAATLSCATIFLGVKAIEYSHKFEMGLLPAGLFSYDPSHPHHSEGISIYLVWMSIPFALIFLGLVTWYTIAAIQRNKFQMRVSGPLIVVAACYFVGVGLGTILESGSSEHDSAAVAHAGDHDSHVEHAAEEHAGEDHADGAQPVEAGNTEGEAPVMAEDASGEDGVPSVLSQLAKDSANTGVRQQIDAEQRQESMAEAAPTDDESVPVVESGTIDVFNPAYAGVFFGIYYCMTGIHAIHILAGIAALTWLLVRSVRRDFNRQYFGPVDYVGLYWHIVDLIWIYLFPLLYLIT